MARWLIVAGVALVLLGILWAAFPRALSWFGSLPGDIDIRRNGTRIVIPITSMLVASLVLSLLLNVIGWLLRALR